MVKIEVMDSSPPTHHHQQSPWINRRVQRSALFAFVILTIVVMGFYGRSTLPEATDLGRGSDEYSSKTPSSAHPNPSDPTVDTTAGTAHDFYTSEGFHDTKPDPNAVPSKKPEKPAAKPENGLIDPTRVALIIETRPVPHLPALLSAFIGTLPAKWQVKVIGLQPSFDLIKGSSSLRGHIKSHKLVLQDLSVDYPATNNEDLSATLTNLTFYRDFLAPAEWLLLFQTDSMICSGSDQSVDDWVEKGYDWVGAPWALDVKGGNGGLSLRHVPAIVKVLSNETRKAKAEWEDLWLCERLTNLAPGTIEKDFSVESLYVERPLGYHLRGSGKLIDAGIWANKTRKRQIFEYCPEIKIIMGNMGLEPADEEQQKLKDEEALRPEPTDKIAQEIMSGFEQPTASSLIANAAGITPTSAVPEATSKAPAPTQIANEIYDDDKPSPAVIAESKVMDDALAAEETSRWND